MRLWSAEVSGDQIVGYKEENGFIDRFVLERNNKVTFEGRWKLSDYKSDIERWKGVMGKFDPYTVFWKTPEEIIYLDFNDVERIAMKNA